MGQFSRSSIGFDLTVKKKTVDDNNGAGEFVKLTKDGDDEEVEMTLVKLNVEEDYETEDDDSDDDDDDEEEEELDEEEGTKLRF